MRIPIRITPEGKIYGMFPDSMDLRKLGRVKVSRLSHVEFNDRAQAWTIYSCLDKRYLMFAFKTRKAALAYERKYMESMLSEIRKMFVA